jgi:hypothetical protein
MFSTIVNSSANAAQLWCLIAVIVAIVYTVWSLTLRSFPAALLGAAVVFIALGLLWGLPG